MKKTVLILHFTFYILHFAFSQVNLVPNPSFEDTVLCPITVSEIFKAENWFSFRSTPDYYHSCDNPINGVVGVPYNNLGFQIPHSGIAYSGIIPFDLTGAPYREFLATQLISSLSIEQKYYLTFFVSWLGSPGFGIAINKLGASFTNSFFSESSPYPITNNPKTFTDSTYADSIGWSQIQLSFIADSAYEYLIIGNFFDDANTDTSNLGQFNTHAYYYIDDVCLSTDSLFAINWTGLKTIKTSTEQIIPFPNPVSRTFQIKNISGVATYSLRNSMGQLIKKGSIKNEDPEIDVSFCLNGLYFVELDNKYFFKIIINH